MNEIIKALGFDGALAAHATASAIIFALVFRFTKGASAIHPRIEMLLAALITAVLNVLIDIARDAPVTMAMLSSVVVGAFVAMLLHAAFTKEKAAPPATLFSVRYGDGPEEIKTVGAPSGAPTPAPTDRGDA